MTEPDPDGDACCKVGRLLEKYGFEGFDRELADRWRGRSGDRESVRTLTEAFNVELLRAALANRSEDPLEGEAQNTYHLLTAESVSAGDRTRARRDLEKQGVDVDELQADFVSHQSLYNHLSDCLGVSPEVGDADSTANAAETVFSLRNRTLAVTEGRLERLAAADDLALGDFEVFVDVVVTCQDCGRTTAVDQVFREGGCECNL